MFKKILHGFSILVIGVTLALLLFSGYSESRRSLSLLAPIETVFQADVVVPDFVAGSDPQVQYTRTIHEFFDGVYKVEIKRADTGSMICSNRGSAAYEPSDVLPESTSLAWYANDEKCPIELKPGQYYIETWYKIKREGLPTRYYGSTSNVFHVLPKLN